MRRIGQLMAVLSILALARLLRIRTRVGQLGCIFVARIIDAGVAVFGCGCTTISHITRLTQLTRLPRRRTIKRTRLTITPHHDALISTRNVHNQPILIPHQLSITLTRSLNHLTSQTTISPQPQNLALTSTHHKRHILIRRRIRRPRTPKLTGGHTHQRTIRHQHHTRRIRLRNRHEPVRLRHRSHLQGPRQLLILGSPRIGHTELLHQTRSRQRRTTRMMPCHTGSRADLHTMHLAFDQLLGPWIPDDLTHTIRTRHPQSTLTINGRILDLTPSHPRLTHIHSTQRIHPSHRPRPGIHHITRTTTSEHLRPRPTRQLTRTTRHHRRHINRRHNTGVMIGHNQHTIALLHRHILTGLPHPITLINLIRRRVVLENAPTLRITKPRDPITGTNRRSRNTTTGHHTHKPQHHGSTNRRVRHETAIHLGHRTS